MSAQNEPLQDSPWKNIPLEGTKLGRTILRILKERQQQANVHYLLGILGRLGDEKYKPSPDDKITNPINSPESEKRGLDTAYTTVAEKRILYNRALDNHEVAYKSVPLGSPGAEFNDVEFIAGLWRVQNKNEYEITHVRDQDFILCDKLPHQERTKFDFYSAARPIWTGGGLVKGDSIYVVARYETPRGIYWGYGNTIAEARAYLGIKLYDEYQDLIHSVLFSSESANQK